jgi:hypothetical protein
LRRRPLKEIPVDQAVLETAFLSCRQQLVDGVPKLRPDGTPITIVECLSRMTDRPPEVIAVKVGGVVPKLDDYARVRFTDLRAVPWTMGARSGVSFRAESVSAVGVSK